MTTRPADAAPCGATAPPAHDDPTIWRVDDVLWARLAPLLVVDKPRKKSGRPQTFGDKGAELKKEYHERRRGGERRG